jgi:hypothetical protein
MNAAHTPCQLAGHLPGRAAPSEMRPLGGSAVHVVASVGAGNPQ